MTFAKTKFRPHFLLTRFNVDWGPKGVPGREWLTHRFSLFERFCFPSVRAQINQNFKWLVLFDTNTPDDFRTQIQEFSKWDNFIAIYMEKYDLELVRERISSMIDIPGYLITTRLDNDDALRKDFVDVVQKFFSYQECEFINFPAGYVWHNNEIYFSRQPSNPFISLIERVEPIRTAWCGNHREVSSIGPVRQAEVGPAWLQVVHEMNLLNRLRGIKQPLTRLVDQFAIKVSIDQAKKTL